MKLRQLLSATQSQFIPKKLGDLDIPSISCDSRRIDPDSLFVALPGASLNGADFIVDAVKKGARVIVKDQDVSIESLPAKVAVVNVDDSRRFWRDLVRSFYGNPSQQVATFGVTGTNGKTTVTYFLEAILRNWGCACGVVGTINCRVGSQEWPSPNTTPGLLENQKFLNDLVKNNVRYCAMEVSSHALEQGRVDLIDFAVALFTNLTGDHLDYHGTMENYFRAKALLFERLSPDAFAVINADDEYGCRLLKMTQAKIMTYGIEAAADFRAVDIESSIRGTVFGVQTPQEKFSVKTRLIGRHNVSNILAAITAATALGIPSQNIKCGIEQLVGVPGRLEAVDAGQSFSVFVDYAHTHDALENILTSVRKVSPARILLVFGCGGNRDKTKRSKMGRVASELADFSFLTSDNPRHEDPASIISEIERGFLQKNYAVVLDRKEAILQALASAAEGDVVIIAGKGHETYQIFNDRTIHFDDREVARELLNVHSKRNC